MSTAFWIGLAKWLPTRLVKWSADLMLVHYQRVNTSPDPRNPGTVNVTNPTFLEVWNQWDKDRC